MHSMTMRGLVLAASILTGGAQATALNTSISCTQNLALNALGSGLRIDCQGALSISGGSIESEGSLSLYSDTSITLIDVLLKADALALYAPVVDSRSTAQLEGNTISVDQHTWPFPVPINKTEVFLTSGSVVVFSQPSSPGRELTIRQPSSISSTTTVGLDLEGTVYLSNPTGVQFGTSGRISITPWSVVEAAPVLQVQQAALVPEPSTWALLAAGLGMMGMMRRRQG